MGADELSLSFGLEGHTVVMTGGTGVLGQGLAAGMARAGANVALIVRDVEKAHAIFSNHAALAEHFFVVPGNVTDGNSLRAARGAILERFVRVDAVVNGAGGNQPEATSGPDRSFFELSDAAIRDVVDLNLMGTILPSQVFAEAMARQGTGVILNIASMNAIRPLTRIPAYSAAKAAVANFTQWLAVHMAQEYAPYIRVNAIAPRFFLTEQNRYLLIDRDTGDLTSRGSSIIAHTPMGRFGEPDDLLGTCLWLLSPASKFVTGIIVPVDGGFSAFSGV